MRRRTAVFVIILIAVALVVLAQTRSARNNAAATATNEAHAPSKATVESFMRHMFGWNKEMKWTLASIGPSGAAGVTEVAMDMETPRGKGTQKLFITSDHKHAIAGAMLAFPGKPGIKPAEEQINSFVRQQTGGNPGITSTTAENKADALSGMTEITVVLTNPKGERGAQRFWVTEDGGHALLGDLLPFGADPFAPARAELAREAHGPARGPANAPLTIVEFADLQCPSCKMAAPIIERLLADEPNARFIFEQFPLTQIHKWAMKAAEFGDCVARENEAAFWKFLHNVYDQQESITEVNATQKLTEAATQSGVDAKKVAACAADPATATHIEQSMALGKKMNVTGTPTLFVNGRQISNLGGMPYETLKQVVNFMATPAGK